MVEAYLGLGSNLGNRLMNLARSLNKLKLTDAVHIKKISSVYESEPYGFLDQPYFLNMVLAIETKLEPLSLLNLTQAIEKQLGRKITERWGPRIIDIDILNYNNLIFSHPKLNLPHQQLHLRQFVLLPLKEIAANFVHPKLKKTIDQMLIECQGKFEINCLMNGKELINYSEQWLNSR